MKTHTAFHNCRKPHFNKAHYFGLVWVFSLLWGLALMAHLGPTKESQHCLKSNKIPVRAQRVDDDLSAGTNPPCPGLCACGHWGLLSVSELLQCLSVLNTGPDRGKSKNKLTCRGAITSSSEGRAVCLWPIIPHLLLLLFLFLGNRGSSSTRRTGAFRPAALKPCPEG